MAAKPVAMPLKLLDCCPVSDGGAAFVVSREPTGATGIRGRGCAQAHTLQHITAAPRLSELGAEIAIALALVLEVLGLAGRGEAAGRVRAGLFGRDGAMPRNSQGGLLSYGHCG